MIKAIKANDVKKGAEILLTDGTPATVMDNGRGVSRMIRMQGFFGPEMGSEYIFKWSCLKDGTRITFTEAQERQWSKIRMAGFL